MVAILFRLQRPYRILTRIRIKSTYTIPNNSTVCLDNMYVILRHLLWLNYSLLWLVTNAVVVKSKWHAELHPAKLIIHFYYSAFTQQMLCHTENFHWVMWHIWYIITCCFRSVDIEKKPKMLHLYVRADQRQMWLLTILAKQASVGTDRGRLGPFWT